MIELRQKQDAVPVCPHCSFARHCGGQPDLLPACTTVRAPLTSCPLPDALLSSTFPTNGASVTARTLHADLIGCGPSDDLPVDVVTFMLSAGS